MRLETDVVVVGGGVAGLLASIAAAKAGKQVVLLTKQGGATPAWSGAVDVASEFVAHTPGPHAPTLARGGRFTDAAASLAARRPRHPYARLGADLDAAIKAGVTTLKDAAKSLAFVERDDGKNHVTATALGTIKHTALVPLSQHLDIADLDDNAVVAVVEWRDLAGFTAHAVCDMLRYTSGLGRVGISPLNVVPVVVPRVHDGDVFANARAMARATDDDARRERMAQAMKKAIDEHAPKATHVLMPAAWTTKARGNDDVAALDWLIGRPTRELLALPPSAPGERLLAALRAQAEAVGVEIVNKGVADPVIDNGVVTGVSVVEGKERQALHCKSLVLATGRFYAGGIVRDHSAVEALFGLPVFAHGVPVDDQFIGNLTGDDVAADHAIFVAGVAVDDEQRPLTRERAPVARNVFACGSVLEGYDPSRDGSALGVAAATGVRAAENAVKL